MILVSSSADRAPTPRGAPLLMTGQLFVVRDANYVSARWPGDAYLFAKRFRALLQTRIGDRVCFRTPARKKGSNAQALTSPRLSSGLLPPTSATRLGSTFALLQLAGSLRKLGQVAVNQWSVQVRRRTQRFIRVAVKVAVKRHL